MPIIWAQDGTAWVVPDNTGTATWTTTTSSTSTGTVWLNSITNCTGTSSATFTTSQSPVWFDGVRLIDQSGNGFDMQLIHQPAYRQPAYRSELSQAEIRQAARAHEQANAQRITDEAKAKARENLLAHLTPEQRQTFEERGWFVVEGGYTGQKYRINTARESVVANIDVLKNDGKVGRRLCGHCRTDEVPAHDNYLAQKLMIEACEQEFLRIANVH